MITRIFKGSLVSNTLFYSLALFSFSGIFAVAVVSHLFFTSKKFIDSFKPQLDIFLFAGLIIILLPIAKESVRTLMGRVLFKLKPSWALTTKGLLPGLQVSFANRVSVLSKRELLLFPLIGLAFDIAVILTIYSIYQEDFASKEDFKDLSLGPSIAALVLILTYADLIINLSPIAKYDFYKILAISFFKNDPRIACYKTIQRFLNGREKKRLNLFVCLAFLYMGLTAAYMGLVLLGLFRFIEHVSVLHQESNFLFLIFSPLILVLAGMFFQLFLRPCLPKSTQLRLGLVHVPLKFPRKQCRLEEFHDREEFVPGFQFPWRLYHIPSRQFIPNSCFGKMVRLKVMRSFPSSRWRDLSEEELEQLYKINPISYWNNDYGRLIQRLRGLLSVTALLKEQFPLAEYQHLFDVSLLAGQKNYFSRNQDLAQRITNSSFESDLARYFKKNVRQCRYVKEIFPVVIKNKKTNRIELIVTLREDSIFCSGEMPDRTLEYRENWRLLRNRASARTMRKISVLRELPDEFLRYSQIIPFTNKKIFAQVFENSSPQRLSFWEDENFISRIDNRLYLNLPRKGYLLPLSYRGEIFGYKVRSLTDEVQAIKAHHPFIEYFETEKYVREKYNVIQDDRTNYVPYAEQKVPLVHFLRGEIDPEDLYIFEGELNANAFSYMFKRSALATGGLSFPQIHDVIGQLMTNLSREKFRRIIICFDLDQKADYFFGRIDCLKDPKFRALQLAIKLQPAFEVLFLDEVKIGNEGRRDNDELLRITAPSAYSSAYREIYQSKVPVASEFSRIFGVKTELGRRYLNESYDFSFIYHQLTHNIETGRASADLLLQMKSIDSRLLELKSLLFQ